MYQRLTISSSLPETILYNSFCVFKGVPEKNLYSIINECHKLTTSKVSLVSNLKEILPKLEKVINVKKPSVSDFVLLLSTSVVI